jgi:hypothetical protein
MGKLSSDYIPLYSSGWTATFYPVVEVGRRDDLNFF